MQSNKIEESLLTGEEIIDLSRDIALNKIKQDLKACKKQGILICESDPHIFVGYFLAGTASNVPVFLANPNWRQNEWEQVFSQISPALILGQAPAFPVVRTSRPQDLKLFAGHIMIPTGGTSGKIRFAMHTRYGLAKSALATADFLGKTKIKSLCLLPLYHISGLIQIVRFIVTEGKICFKPLESFPKDGSFKGSCLSLVPTQLERFMQNPDLITLLKTFDTVFLGGAPATNVLLTKAREAGIRLSPTYGMTETGSMVTAMHPDDFLNGHSGVGSPLSHAEIFIDESGIITVRSNSLFSGYFPERPIKKTLWETNDEGFLDDDDYLTITGRADRIIITGGEKVDPREVEEAILSTGLVLAIYVVFVPDDEWGQEVVAIYVPHKKGEDCFMNIKESIKTNLANYKIPKKWIMVDELPFDEKGKMTKAEIEKCCGVL